MTSIESAVIKELRFRVPGVTFARELAEDDVPEDGWATVELADTVPIIDRGDAYEASIDISVHAGTDKGVPDWASAESAALKIVSVIRDGLIRDTEADNNVSLFGSAIVTGPRRIPADRSWSRYDVEAVVYASWQ